MKRSYWYVILTYIVVQFSFLLGVPLVVKLFNIETLREEAFANVYWSIGSFIVGVFVVLWLMRKDLFGQKPDGAVSLPMSFLWAFLGLFIAYAAVMAAGLIELVLGITDPSENTESIMKVTRAVPLFMIIPIFCAPILEEIIFRKIIFGVFYKKTNFFIAALLSAVVFGFVHGEPIHILSYASMGFVFAYLYVRTKRLLVPILVHMALNSVTVIIQYIGIEKIEQKLESLQMILIGG